MEDTKSYIEARDKYIEQIKMELLGPGSEITIHDIEHELITTSPEKRYSIGILFPQKNIINADNDDAARIEESSEENKPNNNNYNNKHNKKKNR